MLELDYSAFKGQSMSSLEYLYTEEVYVSLRVCSSVLVRDTRVCFDICLVVQANLLSGMCWLDSVKQKVINNMVSCGLASDYTIASFLFIASIPSSVFVPLMKLFVET